jgi:hypothetical protein
VGVAVPDCRSVVVGVGSIVVVVVAVPGGWGIAEIMVIQGSGCGAKSKESKAAKWWC